MWTWIWIQEGKNLKIIHKNGKSGEISSFDGG
jgi:hypothetical protein